MWCVQACAAPYQKEEFSRKMRNNWCSPELVRRGDDEEVTEPSQHVVFELMNFSLLADYTDFLKLCLCIFIWIEIRSVTELNLKIWHFWNKVI